MGKRYWELVEDGKFVFPKLEGQWIAVEVRDKPAPGEGYAATPLVKKLGFSGDRVNVSWNSIYAAIGRERQGLLHEIGLPEGRSNLRLLEALEWNLMANREGWGQTATWERTNTRYRGDGHMRVIVAGNSDFAGAGCLSTRSPVSSHQDVGFRVAVVLDAGVPNGGALWGPVRDGSLGA